MDIAADLTDHALGLDFDAIPPQAKAAARTFLTDSIGVGIAGVNARLATEIYETACGWGECVDTGAFVLGRGHSLPPPSAAFVNAFQIHCQEFDCVHETAVVHPMATILPALMATAQAHGDIHGSTFLTALIGAVDVAAGIGIAATSPLKFFRPGTAGLFGATLGCARLRGFDPETARNAMGIALAHCSGTMQAHIEGKPTLAVQAANASRAAVMACDLAAAGVEGPQDVFEGPYGYFALLEDEYEPQAAVRDLGRVFRMCEVSHKTHPTGRAAQGGLGAVRQAIETMGWAGAEGAARDGDTIASATLHAPPIINRLVGRPYKSGLSVNYARLCFPYLAATMLLRGDVRFQSFEAEALADQAVGALAERIEVVVNDVTDESTFTPQTLVVKMASGEVVEATINHQPGAPDDPLSQEQQWSKFQMCLDFGLGIDLGVQAPGMPKELWDGLQSFDQRPFHGTMDLIGRYCSQNIDPPEPR